MHPLQVPTVSVTEIPEGAILVDVREDDEWRAGRIDGSLHVPMNSVPQQLHYRPELFSSEQPLVIVCAVGGRSAHVAAWLLQNGVDAVNLEGGLQAWMAAGRPIVSG